MVLTVDVGNTYITFGLFDLAKLKRKGSITTPKRITITEAQGEIRRFKSDTLAIASVVPGLTRPFITAAKEMKLATFEVTHQVKTGLEFEYHDPSTVGADRIANAVAGLKLYNDNLTIIDFGTATTYDVVLKEGIYLGGIICPGIEASLEAMVKQASLIPSVEIKIPDQTIGKNTAECIRSGIIYSTIGQMTEIIKRVNEETGRVHKVIATGGWGESMKSLCPLIEEVDPDLTLKGIYEIYLLNQKC